jgi:lipoprotein-releasing system ATP-binding protein
MPAPLLSVSGLYKSFTTGERTIEVLSGVDLEVGEGERLAILGQSGVGKSTLLHILGTLDHPSAGRVLFEGKDIFGDRPTSSPLPASPRLRLPVPPPAARVQRARERDDAGAPARQRFGAMRERAAEILCEVDLRHRLEHPVGKLSGGERQRVAVARALVLDPRLVLADEPTGNLDPATGERVADMLLALNERRGTALVVVTHNFALAGRLGRAVTLVDGRMEPATIAEPGLNRASDKGKSTQRRLDSDAPGK